MGFKTVLITIEKLKEGRTEIGFSGDEGISKNGGLGDRMARKGGAVVMGMVKIFLGIREIYITGLRRPRLNILCFLLRVMV